MILEEDLSNVQAKTGGIFRKLVKVGEDVRYGMAMAEIVDPYEGNVIEGIQAPTDGIVFYAHGEPLVNEGEIIFKLIHRLHL